MKNMPKVPKSSNLSKYLDKYKSKKKTLYSDFSRVVRVAMEKLLVKKNIRFQLVDCREKGLGSLEKKLQEPTSDDGSSSLLIDQISSLEDVDDLAGCRAIFYVDRDLERSVLYLRDEFEVVKERLRYQDDNYKALHMIVRIKKGHKDFEKYKGLKCEIQLTTILYHAWSELYHDIVYKPQSGLADFDEKSFNSIRSRFKKAMQRLKAAQADFNFIDRQLIDIKEGKQIFSEYYLDEIASANSINDLWQRLNLLLTHIQKFGDKTPKDLKIVEIIDSALQKSKNLKREPITTSFGDLPGKEYLDIAELCISILEYLRFVYQEEVFDMLLKLSVDEDGVVRQRSLDTVSKMAEYTYWPKEKKIYFHPQLFILSKIESWGDHFLQKNRNLVLVAVEEMLSTSYNGTSWKDYKSISIHQGAMPAEKIVKSIRERSIEILKRLYAMSETVDDKKQVLQIFEKGTYMPPKGQSGELQTLVIGDINILINFYFSIVTESNTADEILKEIDNQQYRFSKVFPSDKLKGLNSLKEEIQKNKSYLVYKVLVGHEYHSDNCNGWEEEGKERKQNIDKYISQINNETFQDWQKVIISLSASYKSGEDYGRYQHFCYFLEEMGKAQPEKGLLLLKKSDKELEHFLIPLLVGVWKGKQEAKAREIISCWVDGGKYLEVCARVFRFLDETDEDLLAAVLNKAKAENNNEALLSIIDSISANFKKSRKGKNLFIESIGALKKDKFIWANVFCFRDVDILRSASEDDLDVILDSLLLAPDIDYHLEEILSVATQKDPGKVAKFLLARIDIQAKKKQGERFDAIPLKFEILSPKLSEGKNTEIVVKMVLGYMQKYDWFKCSEAGHLLAVTFPNFHKKLENALITILESTNKDKAKIVLSVLRAYKGQPFLHEVCKKLISDSKNKKYKGDLFIVLSQTGVVSGEYGYVPVYEGKKQEVAKWKNDEDKAVRSFASDYEKYLSDRIAAEKKRADEDIAIRKREFEG